MKPAKAIVTKSTFATAEMIVKWDNFTENRAPRANRAGAGQRKPLIGSSQEP